MRCPFCRRTLAETEAACGGCGVSLGQADAVLGTVPRLVGGLSDGAGIIKRRDARRILAELRETHISFPQVSVSVVTLDGIPRKVNLPTYTFWLFNRSEVAQQLNTDGRNHDVLITIDASAQKAAMIVGYGLEPLIGERHLERVLESGRPHLVAGHCAAAILTMIETMRELFREIARGAAKAFALPEEPVARDKSGAEAALDY